VAKKKEFPDVAETNFNAGLTSEPEIPIDVPFDEKTLPRQTYYITALQMEAVSVMSYEECKGKSELIREMMDQYIPPKYMEIAAQRLKNRRKKK